MFIPIQISPIFQSNSSGYSSVSCQANNVKTSLFHPTPTWTFGDISLCGSRHSIIFHIKYGTILLPGPQVVAKISELGGHVGERSKKYHWFSRIVLGTELLRPWLAAIAKEHRQRSMISSENAAPSRTFSSGSASVIDMNLKIKTSFVRRDIRSIRASFSI